MELPETSSLPDEEISQRAVQAVCDSAIDFVQALELATTVEQTIQIREFVTSCIETLQLVERAAFDQIDALSEAKS